jgi:hypothetical protein
VDEKKASENEPDDEVEVVDLEAQWQEAGFQLAMPIERNDGNVVDRIEFLKPHMEMAKVLDKHSGQVAASLALIAEMTNFSRRDVGQMHPMDFGRAAAVAEVFFGAFQPGAGPPG